MELIETSEQLEQLDQLEPLEAILMALTEEMTWSKLYDESIKIRKMHKETFSQTIKRAESERIIIIKHPDKRTQLISRNYEVVRKLFYTKIKYKAILNEISEFINELDKIAKSKSKKKFLKDEKFFHKLLIHLDKTMYYQKEILFDIQTFYFMTESENDLLRKYAKLIDEKHSKTLKLLKKIDRKYFHNVFSVLQDRLYQESPSMPILYEKDMIEYAKLIGYNDKNPKSR